MAEIINLRQARKQAKRQSNEKQAEQNRQLHGRTKQEKLRDGREKSKLKSHLDGHQLEKSSNEQDD